MDNNVCVRLLLYNKEKKCVYTVSCEEKTVAAITCYGYK